MIKSDKWIRSKCVRGAYDMRQVDEPMIAPFHPSLVRTTKNSKDEEVKIISKGLSSMGYDVTLSHDGLRVFSNLHSAEIDPCNLDVEKTLVEVFERICSRTALPYVLLPPNSYLLGYTEEYFRIPTDVLVVAVGKSTYARSGVAVNVTPIEPGFHGNVVIEIANQTSLPVRIYLNQGIAQFLFFQSDEHCEVSYADRGGKYQGQTGLTHAKV